MKTKADEVLGRLGIQTVRAVAVGNDWLAGGGAALAVHTPIDGSRLAQFPSATASDLGVAVE
jgi:hypothetical protein